MDEKLIAGWIEHDLNPFFLFDERGKVRILNQAAELLLGYASPLQFFQLAQRHAVKPGFHVTFEPMSFQSFNFYGLMAGRDENGIGMRLYQVPLKGAVEGKPLGDQSPTNIYRILDANIALFKSRHKQEIKCDYDPALPLFKLLQNDFSKLVGRSFESFRQSPSPLQVTLKIRHGEQRALLGRRWPLAELVFSGKNRLSDQDKALQTLAESMWIHVQLSPGSILYEIPLVN
ncbi:MAG: hypothetical protein AB7E49_02515 [Campylobacterales bacterium]